MKLLRMSNGYDLIVAERNKLIMLESGRLRVYDFAGSVRPEDANYGLDFFEGGCKGHSGVARFRRPDGEHVTLRNISQIERGDIAVIAIDSREEVLPGVIEEIVDF